MNISYKHDMTHNYMVPDLTDGICEDDYRIHMLMENHIRGLLPCSLKKINCRSHFFYDITSRQSMEHIYNSRFLNTADIRTLLRGLYRALKEVKKYLLDVDRIVLQPDMIYMDIESREPFFCYLPGYQNDLLQSFRELTAYLLEHLDQTDNSAVLLGYEIYRKARIENYSLERLLQEAGRPEADNTLRQNCRSDTTPHKYNAKPPYQASESREYDVNTPYRGSESREHDVDTPYRTSKAREYHVDTSYRTSKAREYHVNTPYRVSTSCPSATEHSEAFPVSSSDSPKKKQAEKKIAAPKKEKSEKRAPGKTPSAKGNTSNRIFLVVCFIFSIFLALIAMWLWKLDTTQIGGIIFLLIGLLAYGLSLESKKKKREEKHADTALADAMKDFQEEPYHEEVLPSRESKPARGSSRKKSSARTHDEPLAYYEASHVSEPTAYYGASHVSEPTAYYEASHVSEPTAYYGASHVSEPTAYYEASHVSEPTAYRYHTDSTQMDNEKKHRLGDTGVLYEENGDYDPHLVLISMDPRRRESIVLEDNCYIIGKLSSESDIVLEHSSVSRIHAKIERYANDYYLCDMNSTNGTFLNGQRLAIKDPVKIQPNDEIAFARVRFRVGIC